ncbi:ribbon-helix-helix domain-containing protein [Nostoc spongiaeforme]|uniref:ribbon-helix-helix domain-containing protein n=1 Tax=Nostoc spongiaeforme TaxID=502487 RepID=UPI0036F3D40C
MKSKRIPIALNDKLYSQLQVLANSHSISMAAQIRILISQAVSDNPRDYPE